MAAFVAAASSCLTGASVTSDAAGKAWEAMAWRPAEVSWGVAGAFWRIGAGGAVLGVVAASCAGATVSLLKLTTLV